MDIPIKFFRPSKTFTEALKERYCMDQDQPTFGFIIMSPRRKSAAAELAHLKTMVLNHLSLSCAGIPSQGLSSLCPNVVDLDLANNSFTQWSEVMAILAHLPKVKYVNVSRNSLRLDETESLPCSQVSVENLALNDTGVPLEDILRLSHTMPQLKELHLCDNGYWNLSCMEEGIEEGHFSSLECLRLNNNRIRHWSEIWKLRGLPQLKNLILSGNPVSNIFYTTHSTDLTPDTDDAANTGDTTSDGVGLSQIEVEVHDDNDDKDDGNDDDNEEGNNSFLDYSFDITVDSCDNDTEDYEYDNRPVSRLGRYPHCESPVALLSSHVLDNPQSLETSLEEASCVDGEEEDHFSDTESEGDICRQEAEAFLAEVMDNLGLTTLTSHHCGSTGTESSTDEFHSSLDVINCNCPTSNASRDHTSPQISYSNVIDSKTRDFRIVSTITNQNYQNNQSDCDIEDNAKTVNTSSESGSNRGIEKFISESFEPSPRPPLEGESPSLQHSCSSVAHQSSDIYDGSGTKPTSIASYGICQPQRKYCPPHDVTKSHNFNPDEHDTSSEICESQSVPSTQSIKEGCCCTPNKSQLPNGDGSEPSLPTQPSSPTSPECPAQCHLDTSPDPSVCPPQCPEDAQANPTVAQPQPQPSPEASGPPPFHQLETLCLSHGRLSHWRHLHALQDFPRLVNLRVTNNPLYDSVDSEDKRKLYIASLPKVTVLNGSEVTGPEREKAERHYLRYFMDAEDKPDLYHQHVKKHGQPSKLVDIVIGAGYQDYATLAFVYEGATQFSKRLYLRDPVGKLRLLIAGEMGLPKHSFTMFHHACGPSHPESERDLLELRCESLPMSRMDFADGDQIHISLK